VFRERLAGVPKSVPKSPFRGVSEYSSVLLDYSDNQRIMTLRYQPFLAENVGVCIDVGHALMG
jgi:hypothetical protein